jgi:hypothetical protein
MARVAARGSHKRDVGLLGWRRHRLCCFRFIIVATCYREIKQNLTNRMNAAGCAKEIKEGQFSLALFTLVTAMTRKALIFLFALFLVPAALAANVKDALNHKYKHQIIGLRSPYSSGEQKFDSAGHTLNPPPGGPCLVYGGIYVEKINLSSDALRLEGPRAALITEKKRSEPILIRFSKPVRVEIQLDHPLKSLEDAEAILGRVFFLGADVGEHAKPEFRRSDYNPPDQEIYYVKKDDVLPPEPHTRRSPNFRKRLAVRDFRGLS